MNKLRLGLWVMLTLLAGRVNASTVFLETFAPPDASYASGGWVLFDDAYIGIRFTTTQQTHLSNIVGTFWGRGNFFSAITQLAGPGDFPKPTPGFQPGDVLAYSQIAVNTGFSVNTGIANPSVDNLFPINLALEAGSYFVFFGASDSSSLGYMPGSTDLGKSTIPLSDYLEFSKFPQSPNVNGWFEFESSGVRVALLATPVPLPNALGLFSFGVLVLKLRRKSVRAANKPMDPTR